MKKKQDYEMMRQRCKQGVIFDRGTKMVERKVERETEKVHVV